MKRSLLFIFFASLLLFLICFIVHWGKFDRDIISLLEDLNCPSMLEEISPDRKNDYRVVLESNLKPYQSFETDVGEIEIWKGRKDYAVILKRDMQVYLAQYVNAGNMEGAYDNKGWKNSVYEYKRDTNGSGIQLSIRYAFFSNGEGGVFFRWIPSQEYEFDPEYPGLLSLIFWENKQEIVSQLMDSMDAEGFHDIMMNN